jgi:hypothetical protein
LLANGRWFSPGTLSSSTTKTGRHDIAEILLKVVLSTINQIKKQICKKKKPTCCDLQSRARTHAVLVIGLYELLGVASFLWSYIYI